MCNIKVRYYTFRACPVEKWSMGLLKVKMDDLLNLFVTSVRYKLVTRLI